MLLTEETKKVINLAEIGRGSLISAKNKTWDKAQSGIVTEVTADTITVLFLPETQNIQNHFAIQAEAIEKGMWTIRYSFFRCMCVSSLMSLPTSDKFLSLTS